MLTAIYGRVSTDKQENSLDVQDARCIHYLPLHNLETKPELTFTDEDVSGSVPLFERPGGQRLLQALAGGYLPPGAPLAMAPVPVTNLLVAKLDRLGRNALDLFHVWEWAESRGVAIHVVDDGIRSDGPFGKMLYRILAVFAEFERDRIRERIQQTLDKKFAARELTGTVPYGFDVEVDDRGRKLLIDNPVEQDTVRRMHEWSRLGWSPNRIATQLNRMGIPTKTGGLAGWHSGSVKRILTSKHTRQFILNDCEHEAAAA